jgi:cell division protein FtsL
MKARLVPRGPDLHHLGRVAGYAALAALVGLFHVWSRTRVVAEGYRLASVQQEHSRLVSEHDRLRLEVEALRAPRALEEYARTRLGMAPPDPGPVWAGRASGGDDHLSGPAGPALFFAGGRDRRGPTPAADALALRGASRGRAPPR